MRLLDQRGRAYRRDGRHAKSEARTHRRGGARHLGRMIMAEHSGGENVHTRKIANFVSQFRYEQIPEDVRERVKLLILDSLGCGIYGAKLHWCRTIQDTFGSLDATRTASVWGTGQKLSSPNAALVNGTQVQGFELDDVHRVGVLHCGAVTLPAVIAIAE